MRDATEEKNKHRNVISGKDSAISALESDVARLEEELQVEKSRNRKMGYVSSLVTEILKGTECIDMRHSSEESNKKVEELKDMIKTAILTRSQPLPQGKSPGEVANLTVRKEPRVGDRCSARRLDPSYGYGPDHNPSSSPLRMFKGNGKLYPGQIVQLNKDGTFNVEFDDGNKERNVDRTWLKLEQSLLLGDVNASSLQEAVERHKRWEDGKRATLAHDIRSLVLEAEVELRYKRHDTLSTIEKFRDRAEMQIGEYEKRLHRDRHNVSTLDASILEMLQEAHGVDKKCGELRDEKDKEEIRRKELSTTGQATETHLNHTAIQELGVELQRWEEVRRDFEYEIRRLREQKAKCKVEYERRLKDLEKVKASYDNGMGKAFIFGMKIVSDSDEMEAAAEFKKRLEMKEEEEEERKRKLVEERAARRRARKKAEEDKDKVEWQKEREDYQGPFMGSPASLYVTASHHAKIRDKINGKYDFSFEDFVSRDSKIQRGDVPFKQGSMLGDLVSEEKPLNRSLFADKAAEREEELRLAKRKAQRRISIRSRRS